VIFASLFFLMRHALLLRKNRRIKIQRNWENRSLFNRLKSKFKNKNNKDWNLNWKFKNGRSSKLKSKTNFSKLKNFWEINCKRFLFWFNKWRQNIYPLYLGSLFSNQDFKITDFHFKALTYWNNYLSNFMYNKDNTSSNKYMKKS